MEKNKFIFWIVVMSVLFIGFMTWSITNTANNFALKCSEFGGVTAYNGQHWECLGAKNGNQ